MYHFHIHVHVHDRVHVHIFDYGSRFNILPARQPLVGGPACLNVMA
jgi:hypothetical protein